jgi:aromatic-L-amino-acid/L-tryptophan decarboxylase
VSRLAGFDPPPDEIEVLLARVSELVDELVTTAADRPVLGKPRGNDLVPDLLDLRPGEEPGDLEDILERVREVLATGVDNAAGGDLAYIPGSGLVTSALGDLIASVANRYTGLAGFSPAAVALELGVLRWLTALFGLPDRAQGVLLSGGSAANLSAIVAARELQAPDQVHRATVYTGAHAHGSVRKAARIAGIPHAQIRVCGSSDGWRLDPREVEVRIKQDLDEGLLPVAIVGAAGTTNTGAIDPLPALADLAERYGVWFHVDAAYGGFFILTERGRARLRGIERADSITLDPHKSLFLPFGTGALLVAERNHLAAAFAEESDYLRDHSRDLDALPDFTSITPELTREWRGLRLWLPLHLHGEAAFRDALDDKLTLAEHAWRALDADPAFETLGSPDLSVVTFRVHGDDATQDALLARVHEDGRVRLSTTVIDGRVVLRLVTLSHRTTREVVDLAIELLKQAAQEVVDG